MGYTPPRKLYVLTFENHPGLEVKARALSSAAFLDFAEMTNLARNATNDLVIIRKTFGRFADELRSWNLEDEDGNPVPPTLDGLMTQEPDFVFEIIDGWTDQMVGVPAPLGEPSQDGSQSLVESLPMDQPLLNLRN